MCPVLETESQRVGNAISVSVIIPTLNRNQLLQEVIESLWNQTLDPSRFEIIVVDNASTDNTPELMRQLQARSPCRLLYHRLPQDQGPARARNEGVWLAQGEFLAFTDSDCRADREWLAKGTSAFRKGIAFVTGCVLHKLGQRERFFSGACTPVTREHTSYPACNIFYRRKVFLEMGGFHETLCFSTFFDSRPMECSDTDLAWRIKEKGWNNVFCQDLVIYHEVPMRTPIKWIVDPLRIFAVPALVKRHPQLRTQLLLGRVFFRMENALFHCGAVGVLLGIFGHPGFLALALPYPIWIMSLLRHNLSLRRFPKLVLQILLLATRQGFLSAGLIYGSIRFRSLVL